LAGWLLAGHSPARSARSRGAPGCLFTGSPASERSQAVFDWTWVFVLGPAAEGCRLIARVRGELAPSWLAVVMRPPLEPTHLVMERKMLLRLKQRAEQATTTRAPAPLQHQSPQGRKDLQREPGRLGNLPNVGSADWPSARSPSAVGAWALLPCQFTDHAVRPSVRGCEGVEP
jgi:hypothetical protein